MTISPGETVGAYRIIEPLGQGGMATVFKAYHAALDRYVAIKVLHPAFKEDPNFLSRFNREARIVAKLDHPNIVPIYDFAQDADTPYLVMRYVEGKTLKAILREGPIPTERVFSIIRPALDGLAYAHAQGVLHRDIKPSNIMVANDEHVYLADFGLARIAKAGESTMSQDMLIGTPQYISPEQASGKPIDERSDIYSVGIVLYEMLTGRVPFSADTPYSVIHDHIYTPLPLPTSINPNLPPNLERVLVKALDKDPAARYASANELSAALDQARVAAPVVVSAPAQPGTTPAPASLPSLPEPATPPKPANHTRRNALIGIVLLLALLACGAFVFTDRRAILSALTHATPTASPGTDPLKAAEERVKASPNDPFAHIQLGTVLANRRNYDGAYAEFDRAIALNPKLSTGYLRAGELAEDQSDLNRATNYFEAGLKSQGDSVDLLAAESGVLLQQKSDDSARALIDRALRLDSNSAPAISAMADYERALNKPVEALRDYSRALVIDPNLAAAHFGLGALAQQRGTAAEAKRQYQMVIDNTDAPLFLKDRATLAMKTLGG